MNDNDFNADGLKMDYTEESKSSLTIQIDEKPKANQWIFLSFQHVFAMFGATILVPILTGLSVSVALFASGLGTLIYSACTKFKVPVYLGSSFAYITAVQIAVKAMGGSYDAAQTGLILVGLTYVVIALIIKVIGKGWVDKLLPPIVIGPMIMVIGLGLAGSAVTNAGFVANGNPLGMIVAILTFVIAAMISTHAKGFMKIVPFLIAIFCGFALAIILSEIPGLHQALGCKPILTFDQMHKALSNASFFSVPDFILPFKFAGFGTYNLYFGPETWAILPVVIVTVSEHIGDHTVLGKICGKNFLKDPGLDRTLTGDGIATAVSALIGGPANTTYGENTGVIGMTKVGSVYVTCGAAVIAILLSFFGGVQAFINLIPTYVLGGMSILLYGVIASNGLRVLIENHVDFSKQRNLIVASAMLVIGLGGAILPIGDILSLSGTALAAIVGVVLNLVLPE